MQRTKIWVRTFLVPLLGAFSWSVLDTYPVRAGDNESTRKLVSLVGDDKSEKWKEAPHLYASIAGDSTYKPVASQAMALLLMRQGNYSDAWKLLSAHSNDLATTPLAYRLGHEKMMLWLWLQAGSAAQAETQFKRLVTAAVNRELPDPERRDVYYFLGGVIGMLQSSGDTSCVSAATMEQGQAALQKVESKISLEQFRTSLESAIQWQQSLQARLKEFTQADPGHTESVLTALKQDAETKLSARTQLLGEIKQENANKNEVNEQLKKLLKHQKSLILAWNTPTPGWPTKPIEPRRPSMPPKDYETTYTTDAKTGKRIETGQKETAESKRASAKYYSDLSRYDQRLRQYQIDAQTYPARLATWTRNDETRRTNLKLDKDKTDAELDKTKPLLEEIQEITREKLASSKKLENELRMSKSAIAIAIIAKQQAESKSPLLGTIVKPSHFELLAWESEVYRLEKCLRETR